MKWILILTFFVIQSALAANTCVDKINQNEAVNLNNVRDQDSVGWCYAYAAADLLSYRLKKRISAVSLYNSGVSVEQDLKLANGNGGIMHEAITGYLKKHNGLCLEEDLPSNDFMFCTDRSYYDFLTNFLSAVKDNSFNQNQCLVGSFYSAFPGLRISDVDDYTKKNGTNFLIEHLYNLQCQKLSFKGLKVLPYNRLAPRTPPADLLNKIDEQIKNGEITGIMVRYHRMTESTDPAKQGDHAAIVVGSRPNPETGECEYLIRNSWGANCTEIEGRGLSCHTNCEGSECRYSGHLWVSKTRMLNSLFGITLLP